jgi:hypothetical protein
MLSQQRPPPEALCCVMAAGEPALVSISRMLEVGEPLTAMAARLCAQRVRATAEEANNFTAGSCTWQEFY